MDEVEVVADDGVVLHVGVCGSGPDVVVLSGGPGCVHYLEREELVPRGMRAWFPHPRGVGRSGGGPHPMARAVADLECVRRAVGVDAWAVLGHSWGSDLAVRYALDEPDRVARVVGVAGHGLHKDRTWSAAYETAKVHDDGPDVDWVEPVWRALSDSFVEWVHEPRLFRQLADSPVPMAFVVAGEDYRPPWPIEQLAELVPGASYDVVEGVPHDFWSSHPQTWVEVVTSHLLGRLDAEQVEPGDQDAQRGGAQGEA